MIKDNVKDKPQTFWEKYAQIGRFEIKVDTVVLEWKDNCDFSFRTIMYVWEHTGADLPGKNSPNKIIDYILYKYRLHPRLGGYDKNNISIYDKSIYLLGLQPLFIPRNVHMAEWYLNGEKCCNELTKTKE